jgi:L-fuconolactonase
MADLLGSARFHAGSAESPIVPRYLGRAMRLDAHQHFWTYAPEAYPWITDALGALRRDFGPADLAPLLAERAIDGCIAVQARASVEETRELLQHARRHPFVRGVVGWFDLTAPQAARDLDAFSDEPLLVGVRHLVQDEPDDRFLARADFRAGVALLAERGLVYDILVFPRHLPVAAEFVDALPDQPFVLDHLAKPAIADGALEPWATDLRELARRPQVSVKLSGLVTEADWSAWTPAQLVPYLDVALEAFGPRRILFGSDWPVCLLAADYGRVHDALTDWAERLSPTERDALFGGNALRVYGIAP